MKKETKKTEATEESQATEVPAVETPKPTPEELEAQVKLTMEGLGMKYKTAKPEPTTEVKAAADTAKAEADKKAADESAAKAAKPPEKAKETAAAAAPPAIDTEALADRVATKVGEQMVKGKPKENVTTDGKSALPDLSEEDTRTKTVLTVLAEQAKYKNIVVDFDRFVGQEKKYRESWEKANAGKDFDPEDEEHTEFYDKHEPQYAENDFVRAEAKLEAREETKAVLDKREREQQHEETVQKAVARVREVQTEAVGNLIAELDPALKEVKTLEDLKGKDPAAAFVVKSVVKELQALTTELELLYTPGLHYQSDPNNELHTHLRQRMYGYENELLQLPAADRVWKGRAFAPIEDYTKMSESERKRHWSIWAEPDQVKALLVSDFAAVAKQELAQIRPEKQGQRKPEPEKPATAATRAEEGESAAEAAAAAEKKRFPNTSGGSDRVSTPGSSNGITKTDAEIIRAGLWG